MNKYRESTYNQIKEAADFLDSLDIDNPDNAIWWCLHQIVWHLHIDRIMWIVNNKELIKRIIICKNIPTDDLLIEFNKSVARKVD